MDPKSSAEAVLAALFNNHFDAVFGFCYLRCGSRTVAEEIASDVYADAVRTVTADPRAKLTKAWLFTVARRRLVDHWRHAERHRRRIDRFIQFELGDRENQEWSKVDSVDDDRVLAALAPLTDRQRMVLILRYLDEMSVSEVAELVQLSYPATESLLARARRSFAHSYLEGARS